MGGKSSKRRKEDDELRVVDSTESGCEIVESEDDYDALEIKIMLRELKTNPERFVLNNLLMCFVFFRNYETDLYDFSNTVVPKEETDLNAELEKDVKSCILPDTLLEKVQENVRFLNVDGKSYDHLAHRTVYVVNENIEVKDTTDNSVYTNIDIPGCRVLIEDGNDDLIFTDENGQPYGRKKTEPRYGFVKFRVMENNSKTSQEKEERTVDVETAETDRSDSEDQSDEYSTITALKEPRNLQIVLPKEIERRDTLPDSCFSMRKRWKTDAVEGTDDEEDEEEDEEEIQSYWNHKESKEEDEKEENTNSKLFEEVTYLSSKGFMEYFQTNIFPMVTGKISGSIDNAFNVKTAPGCILYNKMAPEETIPYKIIPAVAIDWPIQAQEYTYRKDRRTIIDQKHGVIYRWPTKDMTQELVTLKCVAIPKGFMMKRGENENSDIEWEIHFPKATRYLELRMTHPQVRCYMFILALYKTYIENVTTVHGLLIEHIRTHMFWECERDSKNWPEQRLGRKLLMVIEDLNDGLSRNRIHHYFIRKKNSFEDIPSKYLQFAQKVFHDVLQFPLTHFIKALKNLKYAHTDHYPTPNLDKLQQILMEEHKRKTPTRQRSKNLRRVSVRTSFKAIRGNGKVKDKRLKKEQEKKNRMVALDKQKKIEEEKAKSEKEAQDDLKVSYSVMNVMTKVKVLQFFINHFIDVAKRSRKIGPKSQSILYLKQAWYNTKVLEAITYSCEETQNILKVIEEERGYLERDSSLQDIQTIAPPTPMRNPEQNCFDFKENNVHLKLKPSFRRNISTEGGSPKNRRNFRRHKSVGFDNSVKKD